MKVELGWTVKVHVAWFMNKINIRGLKEDYVGLFCPFLKLGYEFSFQADKASESQDEGEDSGDSSSIL